ncbi:DnaD and phage-associated domain-containing protein [Caloramator fervidus]|uniref:DnaD and phage-associated domain-containing protein n=1 Tax=Caloramator fervidus TaxID=29344 RepID=A0A1H5WPD3_9CLOT|nr:DnaD domain protein [Caloramator fervidus]SEG01228.1 DnaD and phage-associated domain-containing protein [Caloramator fervidus]
MPNIKVNSPLLDFIPIPYDFFEKYLKEINGDFLKVYLIILKSAYDGIEISTSKIAKDFNMLESDVVKAIEYLQEVGILIVNSDGSLSFTHSRRNDFSLSLQEMLNNIEKILSRPLSTKEISTYISFVEEFKFPPEVINFLVEYCASKQKTDIRYIEKVAIAWHESNIKTIEDAQSHLTQFDEKWNKFREILNFMGIKDFEISKPQEELLEKWIYNFKFSDEIIKEACRICVKRINEINFSYIDAILSDWYKNNLDSLEKIKKYDKKQRIASKQTQNYFNSYGGQRKYDIKELEKMLLSRRDIGEKQDNS